MPHPRFPNSFGRHVPMHVRARIFKESDNVCFYCGGFANTIDHVVPWTQGGSNFPLNLVACCTPCNSIAGERLFRDITDKMAYIEERRKQLTSRQIAMLATLPEGVGESGETFT